MEVPTRIVEDIDAEEICNMVTNSYSFSKKKKEEDTKMSVYSSSFSQNRPSPMICYPNDHFSLKSNHKDGYSPVKSYSKPMIKHHPYGKSETGKQSLRSEFKSKKPEEMYATIQKVGKKPEEICPPVKNVDDVESLLEEAVCQQSIIVQTSNSLNSRLAFKGIAFSR